MKMSTTLPESWSYLYPFQPKTFKTPRGYHLSYVDEGKKNQDWTIVAVHGNPSWSFYYRDVIKTFSSLYRVCVLDHAGMGLSDPIHESSYDLEMRIQDMQAWLEMLALKNVLLIVHDWGGPIGLGSFLLDSRLKTSLKGVVITNTAAFCSSDIPKRIHVLKIPVLGRWLMEKMNLFAGPSTMMTTYVPMSREKKEAYLWPYRSADRRRGISCFVEDIPLDKNNRSYSLLQKIENQLFYLQNIPSLLLWGKKDFCFHMGFYQEWKTLLRSSDSESYVFEKASHYLFEDCWDQCAKKIEPFFQRVVHECLSFVPQNGRNLSSESGHQWSSSDSTSLGTCCSQHDDL